MSHLNVSLRGTATCVLLVAFPWFSLASSFSPEKRLVPGAGAQTTTAQPGQTGSAAPATGTQLHISIVSGDKATNVVDKSATRPVLEVRDANNSPVSGAMVTFTSPSDGPGVIFSNGQREATAMTDDAGRATVPVGTAVNVGAFQYQIAATYQGQETTATISQANYASQAQAANSGASAGAKKHSNKMVWFLVAGGVAVAAGVGAAAFHGNSSGASNGGSTVTVGPGSGGVTVGAPH